MEDIDIKILVAGISIIASIITTLIIKPIADKHLHKFKLESDYKAEQRKKIKDVLATHKVHFLKSCEALNHRFWNFLNNHPKKWHDVKGDYSNLNNYYIQSFVYRILSVLAWVHIIEKDLIYLDTTISKKEDLSLIKYFRLIEQVFCDLKLYENKEYDSYHSTDHFFRNKFEELSMSLVRGKDVISFSTFQAELGTLLPEIEQLFKFIDGMNPVEKRLRWHRLQILHIVIMSILNTYGYDFQYTESNKIEKITKKVKAYLLFDNFKEMVLRDKLGKEKELKKIMKVIEKNTAHNIKG